MNKGKLVVIEGSDGSGKSTQLELLKQYLQSNSVVFHSLKFPQYETSFFGKTIKAYLQGELGPLQSVNPYLVSIAYAMDRASAREKLNEWLENGLVVLDRYATSNMAHQYSRLPEDQKEKFLSWVQELEYEINNIPKEDIVIFLHVPYEVSQKLVENADRGGKDIHEQDTTFLKKSEEAYMYLAQKFPHWVTIECTENGQMRSREEIHKDIVEVLKTRSIIG